MMAYKFLAIPIEESLESYDIALNILALVDRGAGKKQIMSMVEKVGLKYPVVRWFYKLRQDRGDFLPGDE
ncbi:hypothetical protein HQN87_23925 [Paenibacillus tritici]|uniref:Transposase n=1 Tax=Paenibacillus tritici TaxID=1873425 RepID=A0ABX2DUX4_9BACL|nr:hypothetical protein [Paenibacillus tritici]NQX48382.1 hypothetical protein [Paenibacillus tritici]